MWENKGLLFDVKKYSNETIKSHGSIPFAFKLNGDNYRIFFSSRDKNGKNLPYYIDSIVKDGEIKLIGSVSKPLLNFGELGSFDYDGIMPSSIVENGEKLFMFYIGWNVQFNVSYQLTIGLAISEDRGNTWKKFSKGPLLDRSHDEPFFNTAPYVIKENNLWKMWYVSCTNWLIHNDRPEPQYLIRYAESEDGISWKKLKHQCISYNEEVKSIGRPCVIKNNDRYEMFFSHRKDIDYRIDVNNTYKIGRSTSLDGKYWDIHYDLDIIKSEGQWDDMMREYCHVFKHNGYQYIIYNGNGFGINGFGYSIKKLKDENY